MRRVATKLLKRLKLYNLLPDFTGDLQVDTMKNPLVTVIMPVYNSGKYLDAAIRSIRSQTYERLEFIIIDDGSTDGSTELLQRHELEDARIRLISRENRGLVESLNEALASASGELVARMDSDDISLPSRLELQVKFLIDNPSVSIVGGQAIVISDADIEIGTLRKPVESENIYRYLKYGCPVIHPTYLVRRRVYVALDGYRDLKATEDLDFLVRVVLDGYRIRNLPDIVIKYRVNKTGISAGNAWTQMRSTRLMLAYYRCALAKDIIYLDRPLSNENFGKDASSRWFMTLWRIRSRILSDTRHSQKLPKKLIAVFISLFHYEMTFSVYRLIRCKLIVATEKTSA